MQYLIWIIPTALIIAAIALFIYEVKKNRKDRTWDGTSASVDDSKLTVASGTSDPSSPSTGQVFYRTDLGVTRISDGTKWGSIGGSRFGNPRPAPGVVYQSDTDSYTTYEDNTASNLVNAIVAAEIINEVASSQQEQTQYADPSPVYVPDSTPVCDAPSYTPDTQSYCAPDPTPSYTPDSSPSWSDTSSSYSSPDTSSWN